jgi:hypothetical protein
VELAPGPKSALPRPESSRLQPTPRTPSPNFPPR